MGLFSLHEADYTFEEITLTVLLPQDKEVQAWHALQRKKKKAFAFPFWSKVWPAATGLCGYLAQNPYLVKDKMVLELAAGLGLPSLLAAQWAYKVMCTDISAEAVAIVQQSAAKNNLHNLEAFILNWNTAPPVKPDVLLLSDVNYNPDAFDALHKVLEDFLNRQTTIVLSTPQRIMAKTFINRLLPFCIHQQVVPLAIANKNIDTSIFVLRSTSSIIEL